MAKTKVAIVGGGVGAMSAAFALTDRPDLREAYEVTVYQMGWRLGGKGASGRNLAKGGRIEEHGLHVWLGFYENSFRVIRACYEELGRAPGAPLATWEDAFKKHSLITLMEELDGRWLKWDFDFPINDEFPGDGGEFPGPWSYVRMLLDWMVKLFRDVTGGPNVVAVEDADVTAVAGQGVAAVARGGEAAIAGDGIAAVEVDGVTKIARGEDVEVSIGDVSAATSGGDAEVTAGDAGAIATDEVAAASAGGVTAAVGEPRSSIHEARDRAHALPRNPEDHHAVDHHNILEAIEEFLGVDLKAAKATMWADDVLRHSYILLRLGATAVRGILRDGVIFGGFEAIDKYDLTEWLKRHGANDRNVWWSPPIRAIYDLVFAYDGGDTNKPNLAAGTGLAGILRMFFTYKGSVYWKMQAGMGDTIFAPLYEVLRRRGVEFRFFHRVDNLGLSDDGACIDSIEIGIQATVKPEVIQKSGGYTPLVDVKGLDCWPSEPLHDQLVEGEELKAKGINLESAWTPWTDPDRRTLRRGSDFDLVVLGASLGALPFLCKDLIEADPRWREMVERVKTVPTQAFQLWLNRDAAGLGWEPKARGQTGTYVEPLDTWADMSQLLDREDWPATADVKNISYFCGPLADPPEIPDPGTDPTFPERHDQGIKQGVLRFLQEDMGPLLPGSIDPANPACLDWNLLVDTTGAAGEKRLDSQFWRANIDPTERYVMSVKGSAAYRLAPSDSGFENLVLAGDWTANGLIEAGCVEAACVSGLLASRAICGHPEEIVGLK